MPSSAADANDIPNSDTFAAWPAEQVRPFAEGKTVVLATGGSSRWYFLEHGEVSRGYSQFEQFEDYAKRAVRRIVEQAAMMCDDGITTVFAPGVAGGQAQRDPDYVDNLRRIFEYAANDFARELYAELDMGVMFRGGWRQTFEQFGVEDLTPLYAQVEAATIPQSGRWLVWFVHDDLIPADLAPAVGESLQANGKLPGQAALAEMYYGRPIERADIFISNNKLSVGTMRPPLIELADLYFTVAPTSYLDHPQWRAILYDHLFERRGHHREYPALAGDPIEKLRTFYTVNRRVTLGTGRYDPQTQVWRPVVPPTLDE